MPVCTLLPFCSSAQAQSLEAGPNRSGDTQVLPFSIVIYSNPPERRPAELEAVLVDLGERP